MVNCQQTPLNVAKTEFMLIGSKQMIKNISHLQLNVVIENKPVKHVIECKNPWGYFRPAFVVEK